MRSLLQDVGFALRGLRKSPGFTATAVLTLALGVGANTAIFSITNSVLLRPHNFPELNRLVVLRELVQGRAGEQNRLTPGDVADLARVRHLFQGMAVYQYRDLNLSRNGETDSATGFLVSPNFFDLLGAVPERGRPFVADDAQPGHDNVLVMSHNFWQRRFGGDPNVVGSMITIDGHSATILGIMPREFNYPAGAEVWKPLAMSPEAAANHAKETEWAVARLAPGVSLNEALAVLDATATRLAREYPSTNAGRSFSLRRLREEQWSETGPLLLLLQAGASFVLLLACANLGVLVLIRLLGRQRELAIRTALGASPWRLMQLFVSEALLFCLAAGAAAVAASLWSVELIRATLSPNYSRWVAGWDNMRVDGNVLTAALVAVTSVALLLGITAVLHAARIDSYPTLKEGGRAGTSRRHHLLRNALVVVQIMLAVILLVGAGLVVAGFQRLQNVFAALDASHVLRFEISLPESRYTPAQVTQFCDRLQTDLASLPGVSGAGMITNNPASNVPNRQEQFTIAGRESQRAAETPVAERQTVNPAIFSVLRLPLLDGRPLAPTDGVNSPAVAVVSHAFAQRYWPNSSAIGQHIRFGPSDAPWITIVGVVGDIQLNWFEPLPGAVVYVPYTQAPPRSIRVLVRTAGDAAEYRVPARHVLTQLDPLLATGELDPYTVEVNDSMAPLRMIGLLMLGFGTVALVLSGVGIYGVVGHAVAEGTHEFGVRMALGAARRDVVVLVTGRALRLTALGLALGSILAFVVARVAQSMLFGVVTMRASVFVGFTFLLLLVALIAAWVPARRASQVDPMVALRQE
jgi:putative ABC transport system permease protein